MRWSHFIFLQCLLVVIVGRIVYLHKDRVIMLKSPPASLAQWYKPENERQVWLHTMFKLRREMQAVKLYSDNKDAKHIEKWVTLLSEHYPKIGEMVPEWKKKLNMDAMIRLQESASNSRYQDVSSALDDLTASCESCHKDYRASTATMYRAPDFSGIETDSSTTFNLHMEALSERVNEVKIASEDGMQDVALSSLLDLESGMNALGETCANCHNKQDAKVYPGETIYNTITSLRESLITGTLKDQGRELGTLAVLACARCHGTHRIASDTRKQFLDGQSWVELIKH